MLHRSFISNSKEKLSGRQAKYAANFVAGAGSQQPADYRDANASLVMSSVDASQGTAVVVQQSPRKSLLMTDVKERLSRGIQDHRRNFPNLNIALHRVKRIDRLKQY